MGVLINGEWRDEELPVEYPKDGAIPARRQPLPRPHHGRRLIRLQGGGGTLSSLRRAQLPVGASHARSIARSRSSKGAISVAYAIPGIREQGWTFERPRGFPDCTPDTVNGFHYLHEAYTASDPRYTGKVTVPTLWDTKTRRIVNNESSEIIRMLDSEFRGIAGDDTEYYSPALRARDRPHQRRRLSEREQRRLPLRLRQDAGSLRGGLRRAVRHARRTRGASGAPAIPRRQPHHRGRLAARCRRSFASTSPISPCSSATSSGSPTIRTCRTTCANSTACRACLRPCAALLRDRLLLDQEAQPDRHHPEGNADRPVGSP